MVDYACGTDGVRLGCHTTPVEQDRILCSTCCSLCHALCLSRCPVSLAAALSWSCPDCIDLDPSGKGAEKAVKAKWGGIVAKVLEIMKDESLTDAKKVRHRQELLGRTGSGAIVDEENEDVVEENKVFW